MPDYSQSKIYRIWSPSTDKQYIGSTCCSLAKRLSRHKANYKMYLEGRYNYTTSFEVLQYPDYRIVLIEARACNNKMQMLQLEADHIRNNNCVNKNRAGAFLMATRKQYNAEYYQNNRKAIRDYQDAPNECECGGRYTRQNKLQHKKSNKHRLYLINLHNELNHLACL